MFSVVLFVYHCGVIVAYVSYHHCIYYWYDFSGGSLVVLLWCRSGCAHKGIRTGANSGTKAGSLGHHWCAPSGTVYRHPCTPLNRLVHPCTPWYTLAPPWTHLYTLVHPCLACLTWNLTHSCDVHLLVQLHPCKSTYLMHLAFYYSFTQFSMLCFLVLYSKELYYRIGVWHSQNVMFQF